MAPRSSAVAKSPARRPEHPLDRTLREAPVGPPLSPRERRALATAKRDRARGDVVTHEQAKRILGV